MKVLEIADDLVSDLVVSRRMSKTVFDPFGV
jgi:hypothetical protein